MWIIAMLCSAVEAEAAPVQEVKPKYVLHSLAISICSISFVLLQTLGIFIRYQFIQFIAIQSNV